MASGRSSSRLIDAASADAVASHVLPKQGVDARQHIRSIPAIIVREGQDLAFRDG
jgi:chorismate synthase